jgi:hypothetical protein
MEVQRDGNLHYLIEELGRWRDIIGVDYSKHKSKMLARKF